MPEVPVRSVFTVRLLQTYSKHCVATKTLTAVRIQAESERRETEAGRRIPASALQPRPEQVDELVRLYQEIKSVKGLARQVGLHHQTVRKHLKARGVHIEQVASMNSKQIALAVEFYEAGQSSIVIGKRLGFDNHTVIKSLRAFGVHIRPQLGRT
jgi:transposase-like protein